MLTVKALVHSVETQRLMQSHTRLGAGDAKVTTAQVLSALSLRSSEKKIQFKGHYAKASRQLDIRYISWKSRLQEW